MAKKKKDKESASEEEEKEDPKAKPKAKAKAKGKDGDAAKDGEDAGDNAEAGEGEEGSEGGKKKLPLVKIAIFGGAPLLLIIVGVVVALMLGVFGGHKHDKVADKANDQKPAANEVQFYDLPEILVNLNTGGKSESYLKLQVAIEIPKTAVLNRGQLQAVYIVGNDQLASLRFVTLGAGSGDEIEVLSGLQSGDRIVTQPGDRELNGKQVEAQ